MKLIIDIPDEAYSMVMNTTFTEDTEIMFKQSAEDRRKTLQLFAILDSVKSGKPYEDRQQGVWIDHSEEGYVECPICEHLTNCDDNIDELHYCWNCGAYMQKGSTK